VHVGEIAHVVENIEYLTDLRTSGRLDLDACDRLISDQRILGANLAEAAKIEAGRGGPPNQTIRIEGGLPRLPGADVIMPGDPSAVMANAFPAVKNGASVREGMITPMTPVIPPSATWPNDPMPPKPKDEDPA
jgi:hypothetical protein